VVKSRVTFDEMWPTLDLPEGTLATVTLSLPRSAARTTTDLPRLSIQDEPEQSDTQAQLVLGPVLGKGGMGIVHSARQPLLNRDVAIKQLLPGASENAGAALMREAQFMGSLEHPNIVPVHDLGAGAEGSPVLVMKRIDGVPWQDLIEYPEHPSWTGLKDRADDPLGRNISVMLDLCRAVRWAHGRGVVHRDLKPDNVLIGNDGEVYLGDWGVAGQAGEISNSVVGTPAYMAPEMLDRTATIDPQMDVYLLGSCLHQLLTGTHRHEGTTLEAIFESIHDSGPVTLGPEVPVELAELCQRSTSWDPAERPAGVTQFADALRSWQRHREADRLVRAAAKRAEHLGELLSKQEPDPVAVLTTAAEVRFGFRQALEGWPEHPTARKELVEVLREMTRFAISREDLDTGRAQLAELSDLGEDESALHADLAAVTQVVESRKKLAADLDWSIGAKQRNAVLGVLWFVGLGVSTYAYGTKIDDQLTHETLIQFAAVTLGAIVLGVFFARRTLNRNIINRQGVVGVLLWGLLLLAHRVASSTTSEPVDTSRILIEDLWLLAGTSCVLVVLLPRLAIGFAIVCSITAIVATQWPELAVPGMAVASTLAPLASYSLYLLIVKRSGTPPS
jgi:serine/threonine-protein kinase